MEKQYSGTCVAAFALWVVTFVLIFAGSILDVVTGNVYNPLAIALIAHGLALSAAAATMSMRKMIRDHNRLLREAFEFGRDSADSGSAPVRRLH